MNLMLLAHPWLARPSSSFPIFINEVSPISDHSISILLLRMDR
jgi:hypothetical protein